MPLGNPFIQGQPLSPFAGLQQWVSPRRNTLAALGAGLASGNNFGSGVANALMLAAQGRQADDAYATSQKAEADRRAQLNQTVEYLRKAAPQYADAVQAGVLSPSDAYRQFLADQKGAGPQAPIELSPGATLYDPNTNKPLYTAPAAAKEPSLPTSYQEFLLSQENPDYAARLNSTTSKPPTDAKVRGESLYAVVKPDADILLGDGTQQNPGIFSALADLGDQTKDIGAFGVNPGRGATSPNYQRAMNAVGNIAQSYLYAISGQAAPASEVAKIIDSVTPKPFENAISVLEKKKRLATYVKAIQIAAERGIPMPGGQQSGGQTTSTGVPWSIEDM